MAEFYFFTENDFTQSSNAFGRIDDNQYRICSLFSAINDLKAFAVTKGQVLIQEIASSNLINIVLKPILQPDLNMPKIDYIIYKGVKRDSLVNGQEVATSNTNDLTRSIWDSTTEFYNQAGTPMVNPLASTALGLGYSSSPAAPEYEALNTDPLDKAFYHNSNTLFSVEGGWHIGNFDSSSFGIMIIFEEIGFKPAFNLAREIDSIYTVAPLPANPNNAQIFRRKHDKEVVHNFIDPTAFFSAFSESGLNLYNGGVFEKKSTNELYNAITSKAINKNKIYIDIINDFGNSFNYYENYNNTIHYNLDNSSSLVNLDYYRNTWPVLVFEDAEFEAANTDKIIKLSLARGDNEFPLIYYKRAYLNNSGLDLPAGVSQFYSPPVVNNYVSIEDLTTPRVNNVISSNYYRIKIIKRVILSNDAQNDFPRQGYSIFKRSYLDNLFPIFEMSTPFLNANQTNLKIYYDASYIDKILIEEGNINDNLTDYAVKDYVNNLGVAVDANQRSFIAAPFAYHVNRDSNNDFIPITSMEAANNNPFLIELNESLSAVDLVRDSFTINGVVTEYLKFINNPQEEGEEVLPPYSFDDAIIVSLTNVQFQQLEGIKQQHFPDPYRVFLGLKNISVLLDDLGRKYTSFDLVLRGLHEVNGEIETHEEPVNITAVTDAQILGVQSAHIFPIPTPYITDDYGTRNGTHNGLDLGAPNAADNLGQPIYAATGGTVRQAVHRNQLTSQGGTDNNRGGIRVRIEADNGLEYNYFHMQAGSNDHINIGDIIAQGDHIGNVGGSGSGNLNQFGPHLHFEIWNGSLNRINPYSVFPELALLPYARHRDG